MKDFGTIVCRKKVELKPELVLLMKRTLLSLQILRREKERSSFGRIKERETSKASQSLICRRSSATIVVSQDTMLKIASAGKEKVDTMHLQPKQMKNLRTKGQMNPM